MCGIAGLLNLDLAAPTPDAALARRMAEAIRHRGPDGTGVHAAGPVALAHARLAIIDLAGGAQPMASADGAAWICFNGEIFNYLELRAELEARGRRFRTHSDTEVLLAAMLEWGEAALDKLDGQWAFALWETGPRRLWLARDPAGILPLYWTVSGGVFRFASEVKALFADPAVPRAFDPEGLDETLTFWAPVAPLTPFSGVRQVEPGALVVLEPGRGDREPRRVRRTWPAFAPATDEPRWDPAADARAEDEVRATLERAARLRLRADVPVGSYLSGGLDSTILAALIAGHRDVPLRTFSVEFADREYDETEHQRAAVAHLGTAHASVRCGDADIAAVFPDVVRHAEAPLLRTAPAPLYVLARLVRAEGYRVVLTGEGADELFAGYDIFREDRVRRFWARRPASAMRPQLLLRLYPYLARSPVAQIAMAKAFFGRNLERTDDPFYAHRPRWEATSKLKNLLAPELRGVPAGAAEERLRARLPADTARLSPLARAQLVEIATLLHGYLLSSQGDRMLMAHSVEGRFPFLDPEVFALAGGLPDELKLRGLDEKVILKRAFADRIPAGIARRKKQPYRAPVVAPFFRPGAAPYVDELLSADAITRAGILDPAPVTALVAKCRRTQGVGMSNTDEMAFCAAISLQILGTCLHSCFVSPLS
jgi:asparagine synthase (glutamine-hydrolysing)